MLLFHGHEKGVTSIVSGHGYYVIPRNDGRILVGSTLEDVGFDKTVTENAFNALKSASLNLVPSLADWEVEHHWAGLRPGSPNGMPTISAVPESKGLFVNTGHYRNGLLLAPGSAKLMADIIQGHKCTLDPAPFRWQALLQK